MGYGIILAMNEKPKYTIDIQPVGDHLQMAIPGVTIFLIPLANPSSSNKGRDNTHDLCKRRGAGLCKRFFHEPGTYAHEIEGSSDKLMLQPGFGSSFITGMT